MKKYYILLLFILSTQYCFSFDLSAYSFIHNDTRAIKYVLNSQVKYANKENFNKFISTYAQNYTNADGLTLDSYSKLVNEIWQTYDKIKYDIKINNITIENDIATVNLTEYSTANIPVSNNLDGLMKSESESVYKLKKSGGKWKVFYDSVNSETTSMLYGDAKKLNIKLTVPDNVTENTEYTASLEFIPPAGSIAVASIAKEIITYPQIQPKEVFRKLPEDNILERLFIANSSNHNEYIVASIGLTKADVNDLSIKISLNGFGYYITRVNVVPAKISDGENNVKNK